MLRTFLSLVLLLSSFNAFSQGYVCSKWKEQRGVNCVFAGKMTKIWGRQCENSCSARLVNHQCDLERICLNNDPNELAAACSEWIKDGSMACLNPATGGLEQKWVRACKKNLKTSWCSNEKPTH